MHPFDLLTDSLATYRISRLITEDEILSDLREWVWKKHTPEDTKIGYLITCPYCVSVWAGGAAMLLREASPRGWRLLGGALALSGAVSVYHDVKGILDR
jgi:hypothetical protein